MKVVNYYMKSVKLLESLKKQHPRHSIGKHLSTAFSDYKDLWDVSDKVFYSVLNCYVIELDFDILHDREEDDLNKIINDGLHLESILEEEEE